jgi:DNA mismatch endonuclease (patch repair protein)
VLPPDPQVGQDGNNFFVNKVRCWRSVEVEYWLIRPSNFSRATRISGGNGGLAMGGHFAITNCLLQHNSGPGLKCEAMDNISRKQRSDQMRMIRSKNTKPEKFVRSLVHSLGYRFRLHKSELPGRPDMVFASRKKVIFVHGCFWHGHRCRLGRIPKSRLNYWVRKIDGNNERDIRNILRLRALGWKCLTVWQCELGRKDRIVRKLTRFLC